jgi:hypothetical protein
MSQRVRSPGSLTMSGGICVMLVTVAAGPRSQAHAECITQLTQPAPAGAHWSLHQDRVTDRRCWILVDATGRELSPPQAQPATAPGPTPFQSFLGRFTAGPPPAPQQQATAPAAPSPLRTPRVAHVNRPVRPPEPKVEGRPAKQEASHEMSQPDRDALFEEFLRWRESRKITGTK